VSTDRAAESNLTWDEESARGDDQVATLALKEYGFSDQLQSRLLNLSENATYLVDDPGTGRTGVLRVHREDYHALESIHSELDWLTALREESVVSTPVVIPAPDGRRVVTTTVNGVSRYAVLFEVVSGLEPDEIAVDLGNFHTLGQLTARMHQHSQSWSRPEDFTRLSWDWEHSLGTKQRWGRWQDGIGVGADETTILGSAADLICQRLSEYGDAPSRFGLVHADLRLANLLVDEDRVNVIDFDDCGFSWYMYDFGTAVSFIEEDPRLPQWQAAWLRGYRSVAPLSVADEEMLATFVMLRRLLLVAWMGSHSHSRECQVKGPGYTAASCVLAERYVASGGTSLA
jgi:Ser/Thr protein kinase RdoA (MazF antagonist)